MASIEVTKTDRETTQRLLRAVRDDQVERFWDEWTELRVNADEGAISRQRAIALGWCRGATHRIRLFRPWLRRRHYIELSNAIHAGPFAVRVDSEHTHLFLKYAYGLSGRPPFLPGENYALSCVIACGYVCARELTKWEATIAAMARFSWSRLPLGD